MPRELWLLTVPAVMPSSRAVSSTDSPSQCRSTTTLRCIAGQRLQRVEERGPLLDGQRPAGRAVVVAVEPGRSRRHGRRYSSMLARTMICRT